MIEIDFKKGDGLIPVIIQDASTREVLMLGYMNQEAWEETLRTNLERYRQHALELGAAAAEVIALTSKGSILLEPNLASIEENLCSGCQVCIPLCPYNAIELDRTKMVAHISDVLCKGCGVCVAACPSGAISQKLFEDQELMEEVEGVLSR